MKMDDVTILLVAEDLHHVHHVDHVRCSHPVQRSGTKKASRASTAKHTSEEASTGKHTSGKASAAKHTSGGTWIPEGRSAISRGTCEGDKGSGMRARMTREKGVTRRPKDHENRGVNGVTCMAAAGP